MLRGLLDDVCSLSESSSVKRKVRGKKTDAIHEKISIKQATEENASNAREYNYISLLTQRELNRNVQIVACTVVRTFLYEQLYIS